MGAGVSCLTLPCLPYPHNIPMLSANEKAGCSRRVEFLRQRLRPLAGQPAPGASEEMRINRIIWLCPRLVRGVVALPVRRGFNSFLFPAAYIPRLDHHGGSVQSERHGG